jgi:hypothetical protein
MQVGTLLARRTELTVGLGVRMIEGNVFRSVAAFVGISGSSFDKTQPLVAVAGVRRDPGGEGRSAATSRDVVDGGEREVIRGPATPADELGDRLAKILVFGDRLCHRPPPAGTRCVIAEGSCLA